MKEINLKISKVLMIISSITQRVILAPSSTPETVDTQNIQAPNQEFELPQELSRVAREKATRTLESNVEQMDIDEEEGF